MSLRAIVAALGGDLYADGRRANVPAPGHSPRDRSISLLLDGRRVIAHGFGGADWRAALDELRRRGLIDAEGRVTHGGLGAVAHLTPLSDIVRLDAARALWTASAPVRRASPAARYGQSRAIRRSLAGIPALRMCAAVPLSVYRPGRASRPALLAAVTDGDNALTAVEITYLTPSGRRADTLRFPRKTVGVLPPGCAVRLAPVGETLLVAEGVFTALSAGEHLGLPAWALLGASNLGRWTAPPGVRRVLIAGDRGDAGETAAARLAHRLRHSGIAATIRLPPPPFGDWNDLALAVRSGVRLNASLLATPCARKEEEKGH